MVRLGTQKAKGTVTGFYQSIFAGTMAVNNYSIKLQFNARSQNTAMPFFRGTDFNFQIFHFQPILLLHEQVVSLIVDQISDTFVKSEVD